MIQITLGLWLISLAIASATPAITTSFTSDLTYALTHKRAAENVIFSPVAIKYALSLAYLGAEGSTAAEIKSVFHYPTENKEDTANEFGKLLEKSKNSDQVQFEIANRVYVDERFSLAPKYNEFANKYYNSTAENIKFSDSTLAADKINTWVEEITNNKIQHLINPRSLTPDTAAVLVNAIYFKPKWISTFTNSFRTLSYFSINATRKLLVDQMTQSDRFLYADLNDLNAIAVELPDKDTDLSMLILLPKETYGLAALETKLKDVDITKISDRLSYHNVDLSIPKFKIEFDVELKSVLQELGLKQMFDKGTANFDGLLSTPQSLAVSEVLHKASIDFSETGTEAAAATAVKGAQNTSGETETYNFVANHPFFFAIKDKQNVYFAGHLANEGRNRRI